MLGSLKSYRSIKTYMRMYCRSLAFGSLVLFYYLAPTLTQTERRKLHEDCGESADPPPMVILYIIGVLYMFVCLAIVADEYFCPSLDVISDKIGMSPDVAGATLMAAGGSSPELFTSLAGTFARSDVGFGTIVGSAVFNILFVVGLCSQLTTTPMQLTFYPLTRDSICYVIVLITLAIFFGVISPARIEWWEALILHGEYWLYVTMMMNNGVVRKFVFDAIGVKDDPETAKAEAISMNYQNPTRFRLSILDMMRVHSTTTENVSAHFVLGLTASVAAAFNELDNDQNGHLDQSELKELFKRLGLNDSETHTEVINEIVKQMDKDGDGKVTLPEFTAWYLKAELRLKHDIATLFHKLDENGNGLLCSSELKVLVNQLGPDHSMSVEEIMDEIFEPARQTLEENPISKEKSRKSVQDIELTVGNGNGNTSNQLATPTQQQQINLQQFENWYLKSRLHHEQTELLEEKAKEIEEGGLSPPSFEEGTISQWIWYLLTIPAVFLMHYTIPNVTHPGYDKYAPITFFMCLGWMGFLSYYMVEWVEVIGVTFHIPSVIMGLTFLAAGTSVPDMLSAIIVARQGEADKAVSSSIGSNIFDITVGLGIPWLLFYAVYQETIAVEAGNLFVSILVLIGALFVVIGCIKWNGWILSPSIGKFFIFLYFCFVAQQLALTSWGDC